jgi:hypothetical protein
VPKGTGQIAKGIETTTESVHLPGPTAYGSPFRRIARAAKWLLIGAAAGAIAAKSVH